MTAPTARIASSADVARRLQPVVVGGDILAYSYVRELHRAYGIERTIVLATQDIKMLSSSRFTDYRLEPLIHDPEDLYDALERVAAQVRADDPDRVLLVLGCVCSSALPRRLWDKISRNTVAKLLVFTLLLVLCVCYVVAATNATALYANF